MFPLLTHINPLSLLICMVDAKEKALIALLRKNSRISLLEMSRKTGIPLSTVHDRMRKIEEKGYLSHVSLLDFTKVGAGIHLFISFDANRNREDVLLFLSEHPSVNSIFQVDSGNRFLIETVFRNIKEMQEWNEKVDAFGISGRREHQVIEPIKRESFLP